MKIDLLIWLVCIGILIILSYLLYTIFVLQLTHNQYKRGLKAHLKRSKGRHSNGFLTRFYKHLDLLLESSHFSINSKQFIYITITLCIVGSVLGKLYFSEWISVILCISLFGGIPYCIVRSYLVSKRIEAQREFLPAIELFYQYYLITGGTQIKLALGKMLEEKELMNIMQDNFSQLYRNLALNPDIEYSLNVFSHSTGHRFARYFSQMILIALQEGVSIKGGLKDLIDDMRKAKRLNETERHRLLEIRIANFTPILFLIFFICVNVFINREQSLEAYVYDEHGRRLILHSLVLIVLSLIMGIHISRKKMR